MIPGSNLLRVALSVIGQQTGQLYRATSRTKNSIGQWVTEYAAPRPVTGSIQAVPRSTYADLGLDFTKVYIACYFSVDVSDIQRGQSADQMTWNGRRWEFITESDWFAIDGWTGLIAVDVGAA